MSGFLDAFPHRLLFEVDYVVSTYATVAARPEPVLGCCLLAIPVSSEAAFCD